MTDAEYDAMVLVCITDHGPIKLGQIVERVAPGDEFAQYKLCDKSVQRLRVAGKIVTVKRHWRLAES